MSCDCSSIALGNGGNGGDTKTDELTDPTCDPKNPQRVPFERIALAYVLLRGGIRKTPCEKAHISSISGMNIYLKCEYMQYTGSFKERGARFRMLQMDEETRKKGAYSASAGNHAQAMCYHGYQLGVPITVVMPVTAPLTKIQKCRQMKGNVVIEGNALSDSKVVATRLAKENGGIYVNGYDNPDVIAGQGTTGIEILEQVPDVDAIIIPIGGGSLLAGTALAVKTLKPSVKIIGVESVNYASFAAAMKNGSPIAVPPKPTLADGLAVSTVGYNSFETAKNYVDKLVQVKEEDIAVAILRLLEFEKCIIEGAGAVGVAAVLAGHVDELYGKNVVIVLTGGNIDSTVLNRVIERGLAADSRMAKIYVNISDRPGGLAELFSIIAECGASIKHVNQERAWVKLDVFGVETKVVVETRDLDHLNELKEAVQKRYKDAKVEHVDFPAASSVRQKFSPDFK